jgi:hypothetical protein
MRSDIIEHHLVDHFEAGQIPLIKGKVRLKTKCPYCGKIVDLYITEDNVWIEDHPSPYFGRAMKAARGKGMPNDR